MCLSINPTNSPTSPKGLRKSKGGKHLIGYKILRRESFPAFSNVYLSLHAGFKWNFNAKGKIFCSSRRTKELSKEEVYGTRIYRGFHFFVSQSDAMKETQFYGDPDNLRVVVFHIPIEFFVAKGGWCGYQSFVATKAKFARVIKGK